MVRENPLDDKGPEATFARKQGWQVVWAGASATGFPCEDWRVIPPVGFSVDLRARWTFLTIPGAWGAAAQRAGYRPGKPEPVGMRVHLPFNPNKR